MKGFINMLFDIPDDRPMIEEVVESLPTAGVNDDGGGWIQSEDSVIAQREVRRSWEIPENERGQWQEHTPGWWHKKS